MPAAETDGDDDDGDRDLLKIDDIGDDGDDGDVRMTNDDCV